MLRRVATGPLALVVATACASTPSATTDRPTARDVAARWVSDDGSVVAVNLVVPAGTGAPQARHLAERERAEHPGARVIVRVFAATAGPERYVIGRLPAADAPLDQDPAPPSLLGLYDFPPMPPA